MVSGGRRQTQLHTSDVQGSCRVHQRQGGGEMAAQENRDYWQGQLGIIM